MTYQPILTKKQFVEEYQKGTFGNRSPTWNSYEEWLNTPNSGMGDLFHLRNRVTAGPTKYNVTASDLGDEYDQLLYEGVKSSDIYISAMAPTEKTLIQGEVYQRATGAINQCGLYLLYTFVKKPMRDALKDQSLEAQGVLASQILRHYMDPASWDWINELFVRYPDHVLEFSVYDCFWGTVPRRNTVVWEVRGGY